MQQSLICLQFLVLNETNCPSKGEREREGGEGKKKGGGERREAIREADRKLDGVRESELNSGRGESDKRNRHGSVSCPVALLDSQEAQRRKRSQQRGHVTDVSCLLSFIFSLSFLPSFLLGLLSRPLLFVPRVLVFVLPSILLDCLVIG